MRLENFTRSSQPSNGNTKRGRRLPEIFRNSSDLKRVLDGHGHAVRRQFLTKGTKAGAQVIGERAGEIAPRDTGELSENIVVSIRTSESSAAEVVARIGPTKS